MDRPIPEPIAPHPRFGTGSEPVDLTAWTEDVRARLAASRIAADVSRQVFSVVPKEWYIDHLLRCRDCLRPFVFFAREQQYWYEELKFSIWSRPIRCAGCRASNRKLRRRHRRFSGLMSRPSWTDEELGDLVSDATALFRARVLRDEQKLRTLKNLALSRIPATEPARSILALVAELDADRRAAPLFPDDQGPPP